MPRRLLLAACAFAIVPALLACGDDDDDDAGSPAGSNTTPAHGTANVSTASPVVAGPASKYSVSLEELGLNWLTDIDNTLTITMRSFAAARDVFESEATGQRLLKEWGYIDGYQTRYIPEGREEAVLLGAYYVFVETHRFETPEGALKALNYYSSSITAAGAPAVAIQPVGNKSIAFRGYSGKIGRSNVVAEFGQIIFARGNVVEIVLTTGAQGFMKMEYAWSVAKIADEKLLGERQAIEPTPTSNYKTPTPTAKP